MAQLELSVYVLATDASPFPVEIQSSKKVYHLKELIKLKKPGTLEGVEPDALRLYRVDLTGGDDEIYGIAQAELEELIGKGVKPLSSTLPVSTYFDEQSTQEAGKVHVIAKLPGACLTSHLHLAPDANLVPLPILLSPSQQLRFHFTLPHDRQRCLHTLSSVIGHNVGRQSDAVPSTIGASITELHSFILTATLPNYTVEVVKSTTTHPYKRAGLVMTPCDVPYYLIQDHNLARRMYEDLRQNLLPRFSALADSKSFGFATSRHMQLSEQQGKTTLTREATVWKVTDRYLEICQQLLRGLGRDCNIDPEVSQGQVSVIVDRLIENGVQGLVAWEDKSPAVFRKHCNESGLHQLAGRLEVQNNEKGLRAIVFKLTLFMISRRIKWGVVHDGRDMYILRVERKQGRPFIVISGVVHVGETTSPTPIALICYMVLTGVGESDAVHPALGLVPEPPQLGATSSNSYSFEGDIDDNENGEDDADAANEVSPSNLGLHIQSRHVIVYLPSLGDVVGIPMFRDEPPVPQQHLNHPVHLLARAFIAEGRHGRVFRGSLRGEKGSFVMKISKHGCEEELLNEADIYSRLERLCGRAVPVYYGLFRGESHGSTYHMLLLSYDGRSMESYEGISIVARVSILSHVIRIHLAGVELHDMKTEHVVDCNGRYKVIDFSIAEGNHMCGGYSSCDELFFLGQELHMWRATGHALYWVLYATHMGIFWPSVFTFCFMLALFSRYTEAVLLLLADEYRYQARVEEARRAKRGDPSSQHIPNSAQPQAPESPSRANQPASNHGSWEEFSSVTSREPLKISPWDIPKFINIAATPLEKQYIEFYDKYLK